MIKDKLPDEFAKRFGTFPDYFIQAPGRVNLIGEHTDYNGFPVLPISIPSSIRVVVSPRRDKKIVITNISPSYRQVTFELAGNIPHSPQGHWANYVKAAGASLASHFHNNLRGINALFDGDIPKSAGLSSSSALVIASALAILKANHCEMDSLGLAELMAEGEHYVGTQGGGMDQAVCILGKKDRALKIDFFPLQFSYIPFPHNHSIIVAHSLLQASKTKSSLNKFNTRSVECRLATAVINAVYKPSPQIRRLGDLPNCDFYKNVTQIVNFINNTFDQESYTLQEIANLTNQTVDALTAKYLLNRNGVPLPIPENGFLLPLRTLHILTEATRVEKSCDALHQNDMVAFGKLMNASHQSCDTNYEISIPELNTLVSIMSESGALGARLTGAGFGGCAIALVSNESSKKIMDKLCELYYNKYIAESHPDIFRNLTIDDTIIFEVNPSQGAEITALT